MILFSWFEMDLGLALVRKDSFFFQSYTTLLFYWIKNQTFVNYKINFFQITLYRLNRSINDPLYSVFVTIYIVLILISFCGNLLILISVLRRREMHVKQRNKLIALLAASGKTIWNIILLPLFLQFYIFYGLIDDNITKYSAKSSQ